MFERRLKVFLGVLLVVTLALVLRAAQVQVIQREEWQREAADTMKRTSFIDTTRGAIRDRKGRVIAFDDACVDACVDYRALAANPDLKWLKEVARERLRLGLGRHGAEYQKAPAERKGVLLEKEIEAVRDDHRTMWGRLSRVTGVPVAEIEDARRAIVAKVRMRQRSVWYQNYEKALKKSKGAGGADTRPSSAWHKWLLDDSADAPELDGFELQVEEQTAKHVLIRDVENREQVALKKSLEEYPGMELRPSTTRVYPHGSAAAHVIGRLSKVLKEDIETFPDPKDVLRRYEPNDLKGRSGLEALCEATLRGVRGKIDRLDGREIGSTPPQVGRDVFASIDIELQADVQALFSNVEIKTKVQGQEDVIEHVPMHGAAVVIDVKSGELIAMASAPSYDPSTYDELYAWLSSGDNHDAPLINRATQALREPGSTIKPVVGLIGVTENVRRADEGFECTGYMAVGDGPSRRFFKSGRCWVNTMFHKDLCEIARRGEVCNRFPCPAVANHPVPSAAPLGARPLTFADALERSCNPYFESIADALGPDALSMWYKRFGLGVKTYVGIAEAEGRVPLQYKRDVNLMRGPTGTFSTWSAGIGQGPIHTTPLQMANVAATVARDGVWLRPKLLAGVKPDNERQERPPTTQLADRVDLGLSAAALKAAREGMLRVVNGPAGSGDVVRRADMLVAGKTGSAQAPPFRIPVKDPATGKQAVDPKGDKVWIDTDPSNHLRPNVKFPWYRGSGRDGNDLTHAWFIGYAPADDPQVAFAVLVEYGGSGGGAAGTVARDVLELCVTHKYLTPSTGPVAVAQQSSSEVTQTQPAAAYASPATSTWRELLTDLPTTNPAPAPATRASAN